MPYIDRKRARKNFDSIVNHHYRNQIYASWIDQIDLKDKIVFDAGAGFGLLGAYALTKNPSHVVQAEVAEDRVDFLKRHRLQSKYRDKLTVIQADLSQDWTWPLLNDPDIILAEWLDSRIWEQHQHLLFEKLHKRFPKAQFVPGLGQYQIGFYTAKQGDQTFRDVLKLIKPVPKIDPGIELPQDYLDFFVKDISQLFNDSTGTAGVCTLSGTKEYIPMFQYQLDYIHHFPIFPTTNTPLKIALDIPEQFKNKTTLVFLTLFEGMNAQQLTNTVDMNLTESIFSIVRSGTNQVEFEWLNNVDDWKISFK